MTNLITVRRTNRSENRVKKQNQLLRHYFRQHLQLLHTNLTYPHLRQLLLSSALFPLSILNTTFGNICKNTERRCATVVAVFSTLTENFDCCFKKPGVECQDKQYCTCTESVTRFSDTPLKLHRCILRRHFLLPITFDENGPN